MLDCILQLGTLRQVFSFESGTIVIGRDPDSHLVLKDESVSRHHCELLVHDGNVLLRDLKSTNGTFVNGTLIQETLLRSGDLVRCGSTSLTFFVNIAPSPVRESVVCKPRGEETQKAAEVSRKIAGDEIRKRIAEKSRERAERSSAKRAERKAGRDARMLKRAEEVSRKQVDKNSQRRAERDSRMRAEEGRRAAEEASRMNAEECRRYREVQNRELEVESKRAYDIWFQVDGRLKGLLPPNCRFDVSVCLTSIFRLIKTGITSDEVIKMFLEEIKSTPNHYISNLPALDSYSEPRSGKPYHPNRSEAR